MRIYKHTFVETKSKKERNRKYFYIRLEIKYSLSLVGFICFLVGIKLPGLQIRREWTMSPSWDLQSKGKPNGSK